MALDRPSPHIGIEVSSYYLAGACAAGSYAPAGRTGLVYGARCSPEHIVLTNRHHDRDSWRLREAFGCEVHCIANGVHELDGRGAVTPFEFGDELPGGIVVHEVGAICPDETALHIPGHRALACADGVVRWPGVDGLTFVPDWLMDDPGRPRRTCAPPIAACWISTSSGCCSPMAARGRTAQAGAAGVRRQCRLTVEPGR